MICPSCNNEIMPDSCFCAWCSDFVPDPAKGKKANLFTRWAALIIDPLIAFGLWGLSAMTLGLLAVMVGSISEDLAGAAGVLFSVLAFVLPIAYFVWFLSLLPKGLTPGKLILGLRVVDHQTGAIPGFGRMSLREIVGRFLSGLFFGLGYFWALFDKNAQAWHDKLAGTVVLKARR
ncbi:hypothetical protein HKBW3S03_01172 [Candidatus Hakubella thermalkaliphila]|uniref:RDD domain-containing protein n=1 Tax=Candidatus Hakubella thermalkaliphila TaxID=2754717 RepID=A0A6V8NTC8_9ACTN|nr:RDD family protein [Candidatus Hakubella thermalkaliphila]GFP19667.1 hypothetical protein HKBW3S03_01172 [Candidatus Hakubella thermalkaliphila]GFP23582.1 hypothetical protein HKBW3S09_01047 [Candidatus Hakubella thermalkaliphila]GFP31277.1 hypothetical protein HKBW3S34_02196 [Candidatus Hakubella thermalkaliphila]GFP37561.1 hypothetical protein HKBW3S44_01239 [Candidatus Hakubella thermalkaliphila]GFP39737.1 hypothetical protein HKBW3S47_01435 [Candidatus Hakubella thermalkaliphila]